MGSADNQRAAGDAPREWALTVGAPSLTLLLPGGVLWLLVAVIAFAWRRHR